MLFVYFQLLGRFHVLSDFDEGKRSCRRKLERHNNRRRRKPVDSTISMESDQSSMQLEDISCDGDVGKGNNLKQLERLQCYNWCIIGFLSLGRVLTDNILFNNQADQKEVVHLESEDGLVTSTICSAPDLQNNVDSGLTLVAMGEAQVDGRKDNSKSLTSSYCDNKSTYSSMVNAIKISPFLSVFCSYWWHGMIPSLFVIVSNRANIIQALWLESCRVP